jgi:hypothetical protein
MELVDALRLVEGISVQLNRLVNAGTQLHPRALGARRCAPVTAKVRAHS